MPMTEKDGRKFFLCTMDDPWKPDMPTPVQHTGAKSAGAQRDGWPSGDIQPMECTNCGHNWEQELPQ